MPDASSEVVVFDGQGLGTKIRLAAFTSRQHSRQQVEAAFAAALNEMERLDRLLSSWRSDSDVGRVNAQPGTLTPISRETAYLIGQSRWISERSAGAFDITFQSLGHLWRFGDAAQDPPQVPDPRRVEAARRHIDYRRVVLDASGPSVTIGAEQQIGLGGIAKGYIVDRMADQLKGAGLTRFLVQAGGDLFAAGRKPDGSAWQSGVQDPRGPEGDFFATIEIEGRAFSTAGDYARAYVLAGKRYHHIIDPATGYPATQSRSVTIWAPSALLADALDDAVFILGPARGLKLVESINGVGALVVDADNRVWVSERLRAHVRVTRLPTDGI